MDALWLKAQSSLQPSADSIGEPGRDYPLAERMSALNVSAVSVAVVHEGKIAVESGVGQVAGDDPTPVDEKTVFGACSISKAVTAMAALRLVAAGKLPLDADVNEHIRDWRLKDQQGRVLKVTLRQLLTHTGGINIHGADGYDPRGKVPTLEQVFRGERPGASAAIRVANEPGSAYSYSSGGYTILQKMIMDATGKEFEDAMRELVLEPAGMQHSTFRDGADGLQRAAAQVSLIARRSPETDLVWPALAPAGLWTTAGDLARLIVALQKAMAGSGNFLPIKLAQDVVRKQTPHHEIGLGVYLLGEGKARRFSHMGGYLGFQGEMLGWLEGGFGLAILVNNGYTGALLKEELKEAIIRTYGWPCESVH